MSSTHRGKDIEVLDLTLLPSSPEPEPKRRPTPAHIKAERNQPAHADNKPFHKSRQQQSHGSSRSTPRHVHPRDLARIVDTSNPQDIKRVLLHLCDLSPALSGAVARGLSSHSTFAQSILHQGRHTAVKAPTSQIKPERPSEQAQFTEDNSKLETDAKLVIKGWSSSEESSATASDDFGTPPPTRMPGGFPDSAAGATPYKRGLPASSSRSSKRKILDVPHSNTSTPSARPQPAQICGTCKISFVDNSQRTCRYHPGSRKQVKLGNRAIEVFSCCNQQYDRPCQTRRHTAISKPSKRPSNEPSPFTIIC